MKIVEKQFVLPSENINIIGFTNELKAMYVNFCYKKLDKNIIFVTNTLYEANKIYQSISNYTENVLFFPMDDFLTSEVVASSPELKVRRLETLIESLNKEPKIVVTNLMGYLRFLPLKEEFNKSIIKIKKNQEIIMSELIEKLMLLGYNREMLVNKTGEFAVRGFVIDIFPVNYEYPIRLVFFGGDDVDSIRVFNVDNQLTVKTIDEIIIYPNTETIINSKEHNIEKHYELAHFAKVTNISDYFPNSLLFFNDYINIEKSYETLLNEMYEYNVENNIKASTLHMNELKKETFDNIVNFTNFDDKWDVTKQTINYSIKPISLNTKNI